jgi:lipopolysaccharide/colanic/teichoic acid biosynthesis glycosyltransferase
MKSNNCLETTMGSCIEKALRKKISLLHLFRRQVRYIATQVNQVFYKGCGKRILDLCGACVLMILVFPAFCITWILVKLTSPGPAIFAQNRIGLHGKKFRFYKFRSMYIDQENRVDMDKIKQGEAMGLLYKPDNDPRITPVGRFIRKSSLDELPQLWNVIRGDMSLVGPRPLVPHMLKPFPEILKNRSQVRPGLTGLWQISARADSNSVLGMVKYDDEYVNNHSALTDLKILWKTLFVVIKTNGAK